MVNRKGQILHNDAWLHVTQIIFQKLSDLGYEMLPHIPHSPDLSPTNYHFFNHLKNFLQGKCFHNQQDTENVFQEFIKSQSMDFFFATGINLFLIGKNGLIVMVLIFINKNVFESSYNDLKFIELLLQQSNQKRKMKNFKAPNLLRKNLHIIFRFC